MFTETYYFKLRKLYAQFNADGFGGVDPKLSAEMATGALRAACSVANGKAKKADTAFIKAVLYAAVCYLQPEWEEEKPAKKGGQEVSSIIATQETSDLPAVAEENQPGFFCSVESMEKALKVADVLARSNIIPDTFKGKAGDVLIALDMSRRLDLNPLAVMQSLYIVHGRPAWSGAFYAALITAGGRFKSFRYVETDTEEPIKELGRNNRVCYVVATDADGNEISGPEVDFRMAVNEGWTSRNGSKWQTMPVLMLRYRAAAFFVRTCCPEAAMGLRERGEEEDIGPSPAVYVKAETPQGAIADAPRVAVEAEIIDEAPAPKKGAYGPEMKQAMIDAVNRVQTVDDVNKIEARVKARADMPETDRAEVLALLQDKAEMLLAFGG